jgi:protoporphyrinogen oxidase
MSSHSSKHTLILGAGISGLSSALSLSESLDQDYAVYEQGSAAGGLCQCTSKSGFLLERVTHVLHFRSNSAQDLVERLLSDGLNQTERSAWIYFAGRYVPYPFQTHLGFLPLSKKISCLAQFWKPWVVNKFNRTQSSENFEEWIRAHFGSGIGKHFMIPYNTKLWATEPRDMSTDWVKQFVPRATMRRIMAGFLLRRTKEIGYNPYFLYPRSRGIQSLVNAFETRIRTVNFNKKAVLINLDKKTVSFDDGDVVCYDQLISSIPLTTFVLRATGVPDELRLAAQRLRSTSLLNIIFCLRRPPARPFHWVYFPDPQFPFFRLVFPSNISASLAPENSSIICAEISNPDMKHEAELEERVKTHLLELKFLNHPSDIVMTERNYIEHAYPIHDLGREIRVRKLLGFLKSRDVWSIGRFGAWHYSSLGDAISQALETVREIELRTKDLEIPL